MKEYGLTFSLITVIGLVVVAGVLSLVFSNFTDFRVATNTQAAQAQPVAAVKAPQPAKAEVMYNPPRPQDAPRDIKDAVVLVIYYYTWEGWAAKNRKRHVILAFSYMSIGAFAALTVTGILGFMLTPDGWPYQGNFWSAFFNPTFLPQLFMRIAMAYVLGTQAEQEILANFLFRLGQGKIQTGSARQTRPDRA